MEVPFCLFVSALNASSPFVLDCLCCVWLCPSSGVVCWAEAALRPGLTHWLLPAHSHCTVG